MGDNPLNHDDVVWSNSRHKEGDNARSDTDGANYAHWRYCGDDGNVAVWEVSAKKCIRKQKYAAGIQALSPCSPTATHT